MANLSVPHISIQGIASTVPVNIQSNLELDHLDIQERNQLVKTTGIEKRRIADASTTAADLCIDAAIRLLNYMQWSPEEIDVLVMVTQTPDHTIPGSSMYIQHELGIPVTCLALDVNQGCAGYVYGLSMISSMMSSGKLKKGLLLVGDTITKTIHPDDHSLVPVFSDAGSCTAIAYDEKAAPIPFNLQTDGAGFNKIIIEKGGARKPALNDPEGCYLYMNGQDIFNFGLKVVEPNVRKLLEQNDIKKEEIDYFVMHQANMLLNETIRKKVGIDADKTLYSLKEYGNTSCASIPVTLSVHGDAIMNSNASQVLLAGFGVGLSWGSAIVNLNDCISIGMYEYGK
jgi:3-oxoacyl-[acyl-carrier-protein] synthase-3